MMLFLKFLLAHLLGDFVFQPEKWVKDKEEKKVKSIKLYFHIVVHIILLLLVLQFNMKEYWLGFLIIIISHYIFDLLKVYLQNIKTKRIWFFIDQFLHILILALVTFNYSDTIISLENIFTDKNILFVICLLLATYVTSVIIKVIITQWNPETQEESDESLAKAGRYIGILERLLIFVFIINEHWEAVGFLLAAKSIFRFGDLTESGERKLTEYILIGTLLSFGFAILIGLLYLQVSKLL